MQVIGECYMLMCEVEEWNEKVDVDRAEIS